MNTLKNQFHPLLLFVFVSLLLFSCHKEVSNVDSNGFTLPDFETKVSSSVSGFVTDENNAPVMGSAVSAGSGTATTDKYGYFEIKNVQVVKSAAVVTVNKPGYFKGIKTYIAQEGKSVFFRIKMIPKSIAGTINASTGGNVTLTNGLVIALPANGVVNAATNTTYSGTVSVAAHWLNPTASDLNEEMPGDLRGIATDGSLKLLTTYGMTAVELTGASGELLQITPGKKAILTMPIPSALLSNAPATIPLWSFDEAKGLWKEEGQAIKNGSNYIGDVSHFSFWNYDVPNNYVHFTCNVHNQAGDPIPGALLRISIVGSNISANGFTDSSGYVYGAIPGNAQLLLEIFTSYNCSTPVYSQNFATTNMNVNLGNITVTNSTNVANISGTVTDCNNNPVTNGRIIVQEGYYYSVYNVSNTGTFNFSRLLCNNTSAVTIVAEDLTASQQSNPVSMTLTAGTNSIGNLQACGVSTQEFITYSIDGGAPVTIFVPADSINHTGNGTSALSIINGSNNTPPNINYITFGFSNSGIAVGSVQILSSLNASLIGTQTTLASSAGVNITEYGAVGQFIAGNFTAILNNNNTPPTTSTVSCSFRVRRSF